MPGWADLGERERSIIERHSETDRMWALSEYRARQGRECPTAYRLARFLVEIEGNTAGTNRNILGELRHRIHELENRIEELSRTQRQRDVNAVLDLRDYENRP
ncbi:uncharacterized protein LOC134256210 isoform X1 [Saccostrea cucullata]|uniref:uncharacterized protein LOC134256210 isoform X1 n=1 Tax=Saccostrea cuccullata TaxID=36930 RepID=UPI002ED02157